MYAAEAKKYDPDDEIDETFPTWQQAADWCRDMQAYGYGSFWINGDRVKIVCGVVYNDEPYETPLTGASKTLLDALRPPTKAELERILRPVPTNPATKGDAA
jgi:hypothetical protein